MNFTLDDVKKLYYTYGIRKNVNGEYIVVSRSNGQQVHESHLDYRVKFAHAWYLARQVNRSNSSLNPDVSKEKYLRAFDEEAEIIYNTIMSLSTQAMEVSESFLHPEVLTNEVNKVYPSSQVKPTILGLYANGNRELAFKKWILDATFNKGKNNQLIR